MNETKFKVWDKNERRKGAMIMLNLITDKERFNETKYSEFVDLLNKTIK